MYKILIFLMSLTFAGQAQQTDNSVLLLRIENKECAYPRLSADDKRILYQSNESGKWQLLIMDIASKKLQPVMQDNFNNNFPDWSYDNEWIAFVSDRDGNEEIYMIRTNGKDLRRITNHAARDIHPYFAPDGKSILFNSTRDNGTFDVYRYWMAGDSISRMTSWMDEETCSRFSPDMQKIVLLKNGVFNDDVVVIDPTNTTLTNVTNTPSIRDGWPMFSYDNEWIFYSSMETSIYSIYRIKPDGTGKQQLTFPVYGDEDARVSVSRDGTWFIYNKRRGNTLDIRMATVG